MNSVMSEPKLNVARIQGDRAIATLQTKDGMIEVRVQCPPVPDEKQQDYLVIQKVHNLASALQLAAEHRGAKKTG
jgi:hypothetical protein